MLISFERMVILFILFFLFSFSYAVFTTAKEIKEETKNLKEEKHLPSVCSVYYNDGTDRWKDCMQVGYK